MVEFPTMSESQGPRHQTESPQLKHQQNGAPSTGVILKFKQAVEFHQKGLLEEAEPLYRYVLERLPGNFDALHLFGVLQVQRGRPDAAIHFIEQALKTDPTSVEALNHLGNAYLDLNRPKNALICYDRALSLKSDIALIHMNRGNALLDLRHPERALESYDRALQLEPQSAIINMNRGNALRSLKRNEDALSSYEKALEIEPNNPEALVNCGNALRDINRSEEGLECIRKALHIQPDLTSGLSALGDALQALARHEEASAVFDKLLSVDPGYHYARGKLLYSQLHSCEWKSFTEAAAEITDGVRAKQRGTAPFHFLSVSDSAADQLHCAQIFTADKYPASSGALWRGAAHSHAKIRVAYLSADYHNHATAYLMAGLFEAHDKNRFETTAISFGPDTNDPMRSRLKASFNRFIDVRAKSDQETGMLLRDLEIDIAVDLKGFTTDCRPGILSHRPAPIQVNYLGYPGTMGADYVDYLLADELVIPPQHYAHYTEKVVYLPHTYQVNDSKRRIAERTPSRAEAGLPESGIVFCCFNNSYKLTPNVFDVWMRLMKRVEGSVLWLLESNSAVMRNLRLEAEKRGVSPERLFFGPRAKLEDHLARHRLADLFLDTSPFNAHTTASDALWAGLPVVTCLGNAFAGRVAASLLNAVGLRELITTTWDEYEAVALKLATDPKLLADTKAKLARNRTTHPLFNTDLFRRHLETAYIMMWERYRRGEEPASFTVPALG